jgi:1,2-diacylglycerol 3-beta-glucosyltransferase
VKPTFLLNRLPTRHRIQDFLERRRIQRNLAIWMSVFLGILVGTEIYFPEVSVMVGLVCFMLVYAIFLTGILVVKRYNAKRQGIDLNEYQSEEALTPVSVSVIIPAHNEEAIIASSVAHFMAVCPADYDIWVMNDRSSDATQSILDDVYHQHPEWHARLHIVHRHAEAVPGKSAVLNEAVGLCQGEVLAIFDADARIEADFFPKMLSYLGQDDRIAAVQARKVISNQRENLLTQCQQWEYTLDAHLQRCRDLAGSAVELRGNGFLVKRSALEEVGFWNENSITDDLDLSTRLHLAGWLIRFVHLANVYEEGITQFKALLKQRERWAEGSLRRYLDFGGDILFSKKATLRTRMDMFAYWVNFLFPILLVLELCVVGTATVLGQASRLHQLLSVSLLPLFGVAFIPTLYNAIRRFDHPPRWEALKAAVITGLYMTVVWFPIVFFSFSKVLFRPNAPFQWAKTDHTGSEGVLPSRTETIPTSQEALSISS